MADSRSLAQLQGASVTTKGQWIQGLAVNPASPASVLTRILALDPLPAERSWLVWRALPQEVAVAAARHPDPKVRRMVMENPALPADVFATLAGDGDPAVRRVSVAMAVEFGVDLPQSALVALASDTHPRTRYWTAAHPSLPRELRRQLLDDPSPEVRAGALNQEIWDELPGGRKAELAAEEHHWIRDRVRELTQPNRPLPRTVSQYRAEADDKRRWAAARTAAVDRELAQLLLTSDDPRERAAAVDNPQVPLELALRLADDPDDRVRLRLSLREDLCEAERSGIPYVVEGRRYHPERWVEEKYHDPEAMRRAAASSHVLIRRSVARARNLPADVVHLLANDEDFFVKLALCESCDDAPHELLLEIYAHWHGLSWGYLARRPNFAQPGLVRFVDHPNPRLKRVVLQDPEASPELVARLLNDPDVRAQAARDPRLPYPLLLGLLNEGGLPTSAAANPALDPTHMHQLLDLADVPR